MKTTRRKLLAGASLAALLAAMPQAAEAILFSGAGGAAPPSVLNTTRTITNFSSSATSPGYIRFGLWFKKGDVPSGNIPQFTNASSGAILGTTGTTGIQFDERVTWSDGSLKICVCHVRDDTNSGHFNASEARTYNVTAVSGSFNNTGTKTLSDITTNYQFQVAFTSVKDYLDATYGSGTFLADFNTQSATATRVYKYHSGPVCESWEVWGMAQDGGVDDTHLKTVWYVTLWKDGTGAVADVEFAAEVCLDWWTLTNLSGSTAKTSLSYTAVLKNNKVPTTYNTYVLGSVVSTTTYHPYRAHWMTVRTDNDDNHARRYWVNAIPTLTSGFDKAYAVHTGLFPPLDTTFVPLNIASIGSPVMTANYVPCSQENHRANIDDVGSYMGRGIMPNTDCIAFMKQNSANYRYARTNAFAGLHIPYHYRSNFQQGASYGGTKDITNLVISMQFWRGTEIADDFSAAGMNAPINAYLLGATSPLTNTAYVSVNGQVPSNNVGNGPWFLSGNSTHAVPYSFGMYMAEGERHFMQASLDLFANCAHQRAEPHNYIYYNVAPFQTQLSIPSTNFAPVSAFPIANDSRNAGWGFLLAAQACFVCPDSDPQNGYINLLRSQNSYFAAQNIANYIPAQQNALGVYKNFNGDSFQCDYFMSCLQVLGFATMAAGCEDSNAVAALNGCLQNATLYPWITGLPYLGGYERFYAMLNPNQSYDPSTNPFLTASTTLPIVAMSGLSANVLTWATAFGLKPTNGDVIYPGLSDGSKNIVPSCPELTIGTPYYAVNSSGFTCQLAASPGGSPLSISNSVTVTGGSYDTTTGRVVLTFSGSNAGFIPGVVAAVSGLTGTGSVSSLDGTWQGNSSVTTTQMAYNATAGLGAITITGGTISWNLSFGCRPQSAFVTPSQNPPQLSSADGNINIGRAALVAAYAAGATNITLPMVDPSNHNSYPSVASALYYESTIDQTSWVTWTLAPLP